MKTHRPLDNLSKDEFHLKQKVDPFIYYTEKHGAFECITHQNIEAVAAKVKNKKQKKTQTLKTKESSTLCIPL